jgi:hypothetical protein
MAAPLVRSGELRYREDVVEGLDNAPEAFIGRSHPGDGTRGTPLRARSDSSLCFHLNCNVVCQ